MRDIGALRTLAKTAKARHLTSAMCERPRTCGACHWWSGFLGALEELERPGHPALLAVVGNIDGDTPRGEGGNDG